MLQGRNAKRKLLSITNILVLMIIPSLVLQYSLGKLYWKDEFIRDQCLDEYS